jgi:hypothetical protein
MFLEFPRYLQYILEYVGGIGGIMMGDSNSQTPNVFKTVAALQSAGGEKIKRRVRNMDASLSVAGNVIADIYKHYAPYNGSISWISAVKRVQQEEYNTLQANPNDLSQIRIKPGTDLGVGIRDLQIFSTPNQGYENASVASLLQQVMGQLGPRGELLLPTFLKKIGIPEAYDLAEQFNTVKQQEMTIQQLQKQLEGLNQIAQKQAAEIDQKSKLISVQDFEEKMVRATEKFKQEMKGAGMDVSQMDKMLQNFNPMEMFRQAATQNPVQNNMNQGQQTPDTSMFGINNNQ